MAGFCGQGDETSVIKRAATFSTILEILDSQGLETTWLVS